MKGFADFNKDSHKAHSSQKVTVATWNLLADGLSFGEFLSDQGDVKVCNWSVRWSKIVDILNDLFSNGVDIVATQENDHPEYILFGLQQLIPNIQLIKLLKINDDKDSNSKNFLTSRDIGGFDLGKFDIQNDTLSVYYNPIDGLDVCVGEEPYYNFFIVDKKTYAGNVCFTKGGKTFNVINAHLSSGEDVDKATQRVKETEAIIKHTEDVSIVNPIILMDSNSSDLYPLDEAVQRINGLIPGRKTDKKGKEVNDWKNLVQGSPQDIVPGDAVLQKLEDAHYVDLLHNTDNECFKMRHGSGGQPSKFGTLMFDRIDKIVIKNHDGISGNPLELSDFTKKFTKYKEKMDAGDKQRVIDIRHNIDGMRDKLEKKVKEEKWSDVVGQKRGEVVGRDTKGNPNKWEPNYAPLSDNDILSQNVQNALYPNIDAPSDHPPCVAEIFLQ